jgi:hypothetical protein
MRHGSLLKCHLFRKASLIALFKLYIQLLSPFMPLLLVHTNLTLTHGFLVQELVTLFPRAPCSPKPVFILAHRRRLKMPRGSPQPKTDWSQYTENQPPCPSVEHFSPRLYTSSRGLQGGLDPSGTQW